MTALALEITDSYELTDRQLVEQFFRSLRSEATRKGYFKSLSYILGYDREQRDEAMSKLASFVEFSRRNPRIVEFKLKDWILERKGAVAGATVRGYVSAVKSLLDYCNSPLAWKSIQKALPAAKRSADVDSTPIEATRKMFRIADLRTKFLIALFVSSGIRLGALDYLRVKDLEEFELDGQMIGRLTVYRDEPEEYRAFCSTECLNLWKDYRSERGRLGEIITGESPLQRNMSAFFDKHGRQKKVERIRTLGSNTLRDLFTKLWVKAGYSTRSWKEIHGWRAAFKTSLENSSIKSVRIEKLMGHTQGLEHSYDKPTADELARDYLKAQHLLTIDESLIAKHEVEQVREQSSKLEHDFMNELRLLRLEKEKADRDNERRDKLLEELAKKIKEEPEDQDQRAQNQS